MLERNVVIRLLQESAATTHSLPEPVVGDGGDVQFLLDRHWHREAHFVLAGKARYFVNGKIVVITPGTVMAINRWEEHGIEMLESAAGALHVVIHFNDTIWGSLSQFNSDNTWTVHEWTWAAVPEDLASFVRNRWDQYEKATTNPHAFLHLMNLPLSTLYEEYVRVLASRHIPRVGHKHDIVDLIVSRIENMRGRDCSLAQIAHYAGYSRFRIAHIFKERTGMSIGDFVNQVRLRYLDRAEILDLSTKQAAAELGFQSTTAFYNWRRKYKTTKQP